MNDGVVRVVVNDNNVLYPGNVRNIVVAGFECVARMLDEEAESCFHSNVDVRTQDAKAYGRFVRYVTVVGYEIQTRQELRYQIDFYRKL